MSVNLVCQILFAVRTRGDLTRADTSQAPRLGQAAGDKGAERPARGDVCTDSTYLLPAGRIGPGGIYSCKSVIFGPFVAPLPNTFSFCFVLTYFCGD